MAPKYWVKPSSDLGRNNQLCKERVGEGHPAEKELLLLVDQKLNMS